MAYNSFIEESYGIRVEAKESGWASIFNPGPANEKILALTVGELNQIANIDNEIELKEACLANGFTLESFNKLYALVRSMRITGKISKDLADPTLVDAVLIKNFLQQESEKRGTS